MPVSSSFAEVFARRLKAAMALRLLNQAELAKLAGLRASAISHFVTGTRRPSFANLRRLADALDVTTDYLLGRVDEPATVGAPMRLDRHLSKLSSEDLELAEQYVELLAKRAKDRGRK